MDIRITDTGELRTLRYMVAGGQNHAGEILGQEDPPELRRNPQTREWELPASAFDWWQGYLNDLAELDHIIAAYKERFPAEDVEFVLHYRMPIHEFRDYPSAATRAIREAFDRPGLGARTWPDVLGNDSTARELMAWYETDAQAESITLPDWIRRQAIDLFGPDECLGTDYEAVARGLRADAEQDPEPEALGADMTDKTGYSVTMAGIHTGQTVIIARDEADAAPIVRLLRSVNIRVDRVPNSPPGRYWFRWPDWIFDGETEPEPEDLGPAAIALLGRMLDMYDRRNMTPVDAFDPFWADVRALLARAGKVQADSEPGP